MNSTVHIMENITVVLLCMHACVCGLLCVKLRHAARGMCDLLSGEPCTRLTQLSESVLTSPRRHEAQQTPLGWKTARCAFITNSFVLF